jgi:hypothetical protein
MQDRPRRRFTVLDAMILIAALGLGLAGVRFYQWSLDAGIETRPGVRVAGTYPVRIRYLGRPAPLLASLTIALLVVRFLGPRPRWKRLAGLPGCAACYTAALGLAITALTGEMDALLGAFVTGRNPTPFHFLMMRSGTFAGTAVAAAWLVLALVGRWRRNRDWDWVEASGIVLGFAWLLLLAVDQLNF